MDACPSCGTDFKTIVANSTPIDVAHSAAMELMSDIDDSLAARAKTLREIRIEQLERLADILRQPGIVKSRHKQNGKSPLLPWLKKSFETLLFLRDILREDLLCELLSSTDWNISTDQIKEFRKKTPRIGGSLLATIDRALALFENNGPAFSSVSFKQEVLTALQHEWDRPSFLFIIARAREDSTLARLYLEGWISDETMYTLYSNGFVDRKYIDRLEQDSEEWLSNWAICDTSELPVIKLPNENP